MSLLPSAWNSKPPDFDELANFLGDRVGSDTGDTTVQRVRAVSAQQVVRLWSILPKDIKVVLDQHGSFYNSSIEHRSSLADQVARDVAYDGRYLDQPYELAARLLSTRWVISQCLRKAHALFVTPLSKLPDLTLIKDQHACQTLMMTGSYHQQFGTQLGVCATHCHGVCEGCKHKFKVLELEPRFWVSKTSECQACLNEKLMFVARKHNPKSVISKTGGKRKLYRQTNWKVTSVAVPAQAGNVETTEPSWVPQDIPPFDPSLYIPTSSSIQTVFSNVVVINPYSPSVQDDPEPPPPWEEDD